MILSAILLAVFAVIKVFIALLPSFGSAPSWLTDFSRLIGYAVNFIPNDVWVAFITSVALWKFGLIAWSIIEWIYKKIPGVS